MSAQHKQCPSCSKSFQLFKGITWAFGSFCSRNCQDVDLVQWLHSQYTSEEVLNLKKPD